jgi:UDP-N-acetylmuramoyl-L-alanyl-D-glutamate--2,6-diaminopimelate ligase
VSAELGDLIRRIGLPCEPDRASVEITGVTDDSRCVAPGMLFVARSGAGSDGHNFVRDAVHRGAVGVVAEHEIATAVPCWIVPDGRRALARLAAAFYGDPTRSLHTIGVTGTNGKTSVCHFLAHLLGSERTAVIGTVVNAAGDLRSITTPPSPAVQQIARQAVDEGKEYLVVEASSAGLAQRRLDEVDFDVAVFTNLTRDHLDLHGTMAAYGEAKSILFRGLRPAAWAVVNAGDPFSDRLLEVTAARPLTYGLSAGATLYAEVAGAFSTGTAVRIRWGDAIADVELPLHGEHDVTNRLAALGAALCCGLDFGRTVSLLASLPAVAGRWQILRRGDGATAIVDYAHTPDGLERALHTMQQEFPRVILVFGCPGRGDRGKRAQMGAIAERLADLIVLTSDNPKDEDPEAILDEIAEGIRGTGTRAERRADRAEAIGYAVSCARSGDGILVAGKGHETYQIVRGAFVPHSDVAVLERLGFVGRASAPTSGTAHDARKEAQ